MKVVIAIGGRGTRLHDLTYSTIPKGLCRVIDKPLLAYQLFSLAKAGMRAIMISAEADWQIAELKQCARIGEFPRLKYTYTKHEPGEPLNPLKTFRQKAVIDFIGRDDFVWTYGDLYYHTDLLIKLKRVFSVGEASVACSASPKGLTPILGSFIFYTLNKDGQVLSYNKTARPNLTIDAPFIFKNTVLKLIQKEAKNSHPRGTRLVNDIIDQSTLKLIKPDCRININTLKDVAEFKEQIKSGK